MSDVFNLEIDIDLKAKVYFPVSCKQNDGINLIFNVYNNSVAVDLSNFTCRLRALKSDLKPLIQSNNIDINKNVITIGVDQQLTTTSGLVQTELQLIDKTTNLKKHSFNINILVIKSVLQVDRTISKATYDLLNELEYNLDKVDGIEINWDRAQELNNSLLVQNPLAATNIESLKTENDKAPGLTNNLKIENDRADNNIPGLNNLNDTAEEKLEEFRLYDTTELNKRVQENTTQLSQIVVNIKTFGAIGDGKSHKISEVFPNVTLADVQNYDNSATLDSEADWYSFVKCIEYCITNNRKMFLPDGIYNISNVTTISNQIEITCGSNVSFNVSSQFLSIASKNVIFKGKPTINITKNFNGSLIEFVPPSYGGDSTITSCDIDINVVGGLYSVESNDYPFDVSVIKFNAKGIWKNKFNCNVKNCKTTYDFYASWINGNEFNGSIINSIYGVNIHGTAQIHANTFTLDIEQLLNVEGYGIKCGDSLLTSYARSNVFNVNFWLDNYNGKFYCFYTDSHFTANKITGNLEGLLYGVGSSNVFEVLYFTERDRSVIPNDRSGIYNSGLITTHKHKNLVRNGSFNNDIYGFIATDINKLNLSLDRNDFYSGGSCLKTTKTDSDNAYVIYNIADYQYLKGKEVTLTLMVKAPLTNKRNDYGIYINDGVSNRSIKIPKTNDWEKITINYTVSTTATILQINLGRQDTTITTDGIGDILFFDEITLVEGGYLDQPYIPNIIEPSIFTPTLLNGWVANTRTPYIYKSDKLIHVSMRITGGTNVADTIICNTGYPILGGNQTFPVFDWSTGIIGYVYILTNGSIGIFAPFTSTNDVNINLSYISQ